jgi:predicted amidophosphoribosyltransferase
VAVSLEDLTGSLEKYTAVQAAGSGACDLCHGASPSGEALCPDCAVTSVQVSFPLRLVVPISLLRRDSQLDRMLAGYKSRYRPNPQLAWQVGATVARFLDAHRRCLERAGGPFDLLVTVPTSQGQGRRGVHPLRHAIRRFPALAEREAELLAPGPVPLGPHRADDRGFVVTSAAARGARVLLLDDLLITGARLQSAASALQLAGATVTGAVVAGRLLQFHDEAAKRVWGQMRQQGFSFASCCLEEPRPFQPGLDLLTP